MAFTLAPAVVTSSVMSPRPSRRSWSAKSRRIGPTETFFSSSFSEMWFLLASTAT